MTTLDLERPARSLTAAELAPTVELVEQMIGRKLRPAERSIDVLALNAALETAKQRIDDAIKAEQRRAIVKHLRSGYPLRLRLTREMLRPLEDLMLLGRREARAELERAGYTPRREYEQLRLGFEDLNPQVEKLEAGLRGIGVRIEGELVSTDLTALSSSALATALLRVPGGRDIASRIVSSSLTAGLAQTFEQNADLIPCWEYTAVLDAGTCDRCRPLDGREFHSLEDLYAVLPGFGPNPDCLGGDRCRCRGVPCEKRPGASGQPAETLPAWRQELDTFANGPEFVTRERFTSGFDAERIDDGIVALDGVSPGPAMTEQEARVLQAGRVVDDELARRIGVQLPEIDTAIGEANAAIEEARGAYNAAEEAYRRAIREADAAEKTLLEQIKAQIAAEQPGLEPWEVFRLARADERMVAFKGESTTRLLELQRAKQDAQAPILEARRRIKGLESQKQELERKTLLEILGEHRAMGAGEREGWTYTTGGRRGEAKKLLDQAAQFFPRSWIETGRQRSIKAVWRPNGRGHCAYDGEIVVSASGRSKVLDDPNGLAVAIHELGHHLENADARITPLEWAFYRRRTTLATGEQEPLRWLGRGYGRSERYREDAFRDPYMGKDYGNAARSSYEILTMGLEALWTGSYELDLEMRRFILGLLALV